MAPAFERREHHEQISRTVTLIFVIRPRGLSWLYRNRCTRFGSQLLRGLVQANERNIWIARPRVHGQHVFHGRHERAVGLRRDDPLLFQMRFENVFLRVRPIVLSLARSTIFSSTTLTATSSVRGPWEVGNKPRRSVWLPSRHRKSSARQAPLVACGS